MAVRVELIDEAVEDLRYYATSGRLKDFLSKLLVIEAEGPNAGEPLGRGLTGWRKVVVGNRDWRIVFRCSDDLATVVVIGDRNDEACYEEAAKRVSKVEGAGAETLATVLTQLVKDQKQKKKK